MNKISSLNSIVNDLKILSTKSFIYYIIIICDNVISAEKLAKCDFLKFERGCCNSDTQEYDLFFVVMDIYPSLTLFVSDFVPSL
jgi:hypothetical protein